MQLHRPVRITGSAKTRNGLTLFQRIMHARQQEQRFDPAALFSRAGGMIVLATGAALAIVVALSERMQ